MLEDTVRTATRRHYLMCRPTHYDVTYTINPWMDPAKPTDNGVAIAQWERIHDLFVELGHRVELIEPIEGLPDMVFAANGATVLDGKVLPANFRYGERIPEGPAYAQWFKDAGWAEVVEPVAVNEGEGDLLFDGLRILAGTGFRTDPAAHQEAQELFGHPVVSLTLVNPRHYHLDTALSVLARGEVMYYPAAFSAGSLQVLRKLYPDAILAGDADAAAFGLNAVSDGRNVILPQQATGLIAQLRERGFEPHGVEVSELLRAGGAVKCCTLELRGADRAR
ncbi:dimethylargininase [Kitasatospora sp. LaBMicrA B282]|uniref:dimethylargininase n=1 Tax=Kitasatospora sp. LaBMicrA B282 TaxID=3420949 RepID=UPI003D12CECF